MARNRGFSQLQERVNRHVRLDLQPLFTAYKTQSGSESIEGFLGFLATARVIDASLLKELHTVGDVEIPAVADPSMAGTKLAAWSQAATVPEGGPTAATAEATRGSDERYRPLAVLGQGAMGAISIARDLYLRRKVALKTVLPQMAAHPQLLGRFLSEMQITAQLEHPNIVPVYGLEIAADGTLGYAMKLVQGRDLAKLLADTRGMVQRGQPLDEDHTLEKRLEVFLKVCDALDIAHGKGIIHRDLKPANVMVGHHNEVYLMDWGIARPMGAGGQALEAGIELHQADGQQVSDLSRTRLGSAIGTPAYMSPEQAAGRNGELDGRSDQYSMGLILQECVTLESAVHGTTLEELLTKAKEARRDPVVIGDAIGHLPKELEAVVRKATQRRPEDRYPSVRALADDVRRYLRNEALNALPDTALRKTTRWLSKHRMASLTIMLSLGLVGAGATIGSLVVGQSRVAALHARELRASELQTESAIQAQLVDRELTRHEAALSRFAGAAQRVLSEPPRGAAPVFAEQLSQPAGAPADFAPSARYGKSITVLAPVTSLAPGLAREQLEPVLRPLGALSASFRELMIASGGGLAHEMSPAQQREVIAETGVSGYRAVLALSVGVTLTFPGTSEAQAADPRKDPLYEIVAAKREVVWGTPTPRDKGVVLPLGAALHDETGAFRGVAFLEVSLDWLLARPAAAKLDYVQSKLLVTRAGKIMVEENGPEGRAPLSPQVLDAMAMGKSGSLEHTDGGRVWLTTFYPLASLDWYFVATANVKTMLASEAKPVTSDPRKVVAAAKPRPRPRPAAPPVDAGAPIEDAGTDAGDDDAGADAGADAGIPAAVDAGLPPRVKGPMPAAPAAPSAAPSAAPRNPFDRWQELEKK